MTTFKRKQKLPYSFGYELTALPHDYTNHPRWETAPSAATERKNAVVSALITAALHKFYPKYTPFERSVDQHCVEIPSPVCYSYKDVFLFYKRVWKILKQFQYRGQHPATVCGGNHFHFGIKNVKLIRALLRDFYARPEITWVFTQPDDTDSCSNVCSNPYFLGAITKLEPRIQTSGDKFWRNSWDHFVRVICTDTGLELRDLTDTGSEITKSMGLVLNARRGKIPTLEFRGIESPRNQKEFQDQLDFFISYILWVKGRMNGADKPQCKLFTHGELQKITVKEAEANFYLLLKKLKLSKKRYQKYVVRNLRPRWKLGRERV